MELKNKRIIVTGGSDGIGRHICLKLAALGTRLAILGRDADRLAAVEAECIAAGASEAIGIACDIQNPDAISGAEEQVTAAFGGL